MNVDLRLTEEKDDDDEAVAAELLLRERTQHPADDDDDCDRNVVALTELKCWEDSNNGDDVRCRRNNATREAMVVVYFQMEFRKQEREACLFLFVFRRDDRGNTNVKRVESVNDVVDDGLWRYITTYSIRL